MSTSDVRELLLDIHAARGELTPTHVVEAATDVESPLHSRFEWDDTVAGHRYRLHQAGELIRSVRITYAESEKGEEKSVRGFVNVPTPEGHRYEPVEAVRENPFQRELVLRAAEREWKALLRRYAHLEEFLGMVKRDVA